VIEGCAALARQDGRRDIDAEGIARSVEALADGLWLSMMLRPGRLHHAEAIDRIIDLLARHFPATSTRRPRVSSGPACPADP
jgi:hypothetical protein